MINDDAPEQPTTKELPAADPVQVLLLKLQRGMESGFDHVGERLDRQDKVLERVSADGIEVNVRLSRIEVRVEQAERNVGDLESRVGRASARVQQSSDADLEQAAQLVQERAAREALAKQVEALSTTNAAQLAILSRLDKVASNPLVKTIATVVGTALATWAASKGLK